MGCPGNEIMVSFPVTCERIALNMLGAVISLIDTCRNRLDCVDPLRETGKQ
jgi:hypothetical protein